MLLLSKSAADWSLCILYSFHTQTASVKLCWPPGLPLINLQIVFKKMDNEKRDMANKDESLIEK